MSVQSLTKPLVDAVRGKPPVGTLEETEQEIYEKKREIDELENRPPTPSVEAEQKRLDDLTIAKRTLSALESVRAARLKEKHERDVANAGVRVEKARAAVAEVRAKAADRIKAAWEAEEEVREATEEEVQATASLSYLKSPSGTAYGRSPTGDIQRKLRPEATHRDSRMDYLVEMGYAKKVSRKRGLWELEWIAK